MKSSDSEEFIYTINQGSSISELMKYIRHSFRECEFTEVQNILIDRENKMKEEIQNLMKDNDSIKEEARLLERTQGLAVLQKLNLEEQLQMSRRKCKRLKETITRLTEEQRVSSDREKRAEEKLKETITRLTEEQRVSSDREKRAEEHYGIISEENLKIKNEKNKLISEFNEKINELKNKNMESQRLVEIYEEKLKNSDIRLMESHKQVELYESRLQLRVMKLEASLANILNAKVEDLGNIADIINAAADGENVDPPDISEDCRSLVHSITKEDDTNTIRPSTATQSGNSPHVESDVAAQDNEGREPLVSGLLLDGSLPITNRSLFGNTILCDGDGERNPHRKTYTTTLHQTNKRNGGDSPVDVITKRKRSIFGGGDRADDLFIDDRDDSQVLISSDDVDSDDESVSDGFMEDLVATLRSKWSGTQP